METYKEMKARHQREYNEFSKANVIFAFDRQQLREGLAKLGITEAEAPERLTSLCGAGDYILKERKADMLKTISEAGRRAQGGHERRYNRKGLYI